MNIAIPAAQLARLAGLFTTRNVRTGRAEWRVLSLDP
jgi:hypothetical protein